MGIPGILLGMLLSPPSPPYCAETAPKKTAKQAMNTKAEKRRAMANDLICFELNVKEVGTHAYIGSFDERLLFHLALASM